MFSGSIPALATPFPGGAFAEGVYRDFIDWQIDSGSSALVPCGTTGEAATQTVDAHFEVVRVCGGASRGPRSGDCRLRLERQRRGAGKSEAGRGTPGPMPG